MFFKKKIIFDIFHKTEKSFKKFHALKCRKRQFRLFATFFFANTFIEFS
jgi:hypothetical protein